MASGMARSHPGFASTVSRSPAGDQAARRRREPPPPEPPHRPGPRPTGPTRMAPAPKLKHQDMQSRLGRRLAQFIEERALGKFFFAPCDVVLSDTDVVQPDLLFVSREREHLLSGGDNVRGAPDLVVEILSPATADRDRGYKRALYGRHGVAEYWLVDPAAETVWTSPARRCARGHAHLRPGADAALPAARRPGARPGRRLLGHPTSPSQGRARRRPRRPQAMAAGCADRRTPPAPSSPSRPKLTEYRLIRPKGASAEETLRPRTPWARPNGR